jgi:hypothetical protein
MELLEISDTHLTKYEVSYDPALMQAFLENVINDYSEVQYLEKKAKDEKEIISYCTKYDVYKDLKVIRECIDNTRVHQGRKRVKQKTPTKKYLYGFTAITYPEIYYTIKYFLSSKTADFSIFNIFLEPSNYVSYNPQKQIYSIQDLMDARLLYDNKGQMDLINNELIKKYREQGNCLREFLNILTFTVVEQKEVNNYETLNVLRRLLRNQFNSISTAYLNTFIDPTHDLIYNELENSLTYKEVKQARENYMAIEKIKSLSKDNVKTYSNLRI